MLLSTYARSMEDGQCPIEIVLSIGKQLLEQLEVLHLTQGLVHRHLDDEHICC